MSAIERCNYCGKILDTINVHGHEQCSNCKTNIGPCCSGECSIEDHLLTELPVENTAEDEGSITKGGIDGTICCTD